MSIEERTGTIEGRDYAGIIYVALTDDGWGVGTPIKSSRIGKDVGYKALQKYYGKSKAKIKEEGALDHTRDAVTLAMQFCDTRADFQTMLQNDHIDAVFRINAAGRIYGVTFIDHEEDIVVNGSGWVRSSRQMHSMNAIRSEIWKRNSRPNSIKTIVIAAKALDGAKRDIAATGFPFEYL